MKNYRLLACICAAIACVMALMPSASSDPVIRADDAVSIYRVYVENDADVTELVNSGVDLLEARGDDHLLVIGEESLAESLREQGFRVAEDRPLAPLPGAQSVSGSADGAVKAATYYGGYRTVDEHYANLNAVASSFPGLTTLIDYGDSWLKVQGEPDGHDLFAMCVTNKQAGDCALSPNSAKPRAVFMAAIHARELQTAEVAWRMIDDLTQNYGSDAEITHILDTTEVWIIPMVNPDGREIVEGGGNSPYLQRKNANDTVGNCAIPPTASNHHGVDLNRNADYDWGGAGSSSSPCAQTYRGTEPASEPEQASLETLLYQLLPDQKGPAASDPAPMTTTGTFITIHSYGDLILFPGDTPNDAGMRTLGFRMSHYNNYVTGAGAEVLYAAAGTTDDWAYGQLGVPSYTYELSPRTGPCAGFTPSYSCVDSFIWPLNRQALIYSMKVAGTPYITSRGPTTTSVTAPEAVGAEDILQVTATIDDDAYGNADGSFGRPSVENITEAEYYIDLGPSQGGTPIAMTAADGSFNNDTEVAQAIVDTELLSSGEHTILVRGRNAAGFWGPLTATSVIVNNGPVPQSPYVAASAPGRIEAENFDFGGQGVAYNDSEPDENTGGQYRNTGVDIYNTLNEDDYTVGRTRDGEWTEYTFDVAVAGDYTLSGRVNTGFASPGTITATVDGSPVGVISPASNGWWNWQSPTFGTASLTAGTHVLRLTWGDGAQINLDHVDFALAPGSQSGFVSFTAPGRIEAENFDNGGQGVAYNDTEPDVNSGGQYRTTGVDVFNTLNEDDYTVGGTRDGEWTEYTFEVATATDYVFSARVATGFTNPGDITATVDGNLVGQVAPSADGWWNWQNLSFGSETLDVGSHILRLTWDNGAQINLDHIDVSAPLLPFACVETNSGTLTWTDDAQDLYWVYRSTDGETYSWIGRTTGETTFTDVNNTPGATYQVHYAGIPRSNCISG